MNSKKLEVEVVPLGELENMTSSKTKVTNANQMTHNKNNHKIYPKEKEEKEKKNEKYQEEQKEEFYKKLYKTLKEIDENNGSITQHYLTLWIEQKIKNGMLDGIK